MKCAVLGYPIKHSKSPIIHQYWLNKNDIGGSYEAIEIHPAFINHHMELGLTYEKMDRKADALERYRHLQTLPVFDADDEMHKTAAQKRIKKLD